MGNLYEQLKKYQDSDYYPFHMPGHKRNLGVVGDRGLSEVFGIDITEIDGFDNLHEPEGILKEAQQDAAAFYGAEETFFLVNGSTCGILSAIAAATRKGGRILAARNCHKSVYHAALLHELSLTCLYPHVIEEYGIADGIDPSAVEAALQADAEAGHPTVQEEIAAVVITSPTYEGVVSDIAAIADITHRYGKILIVDEAHGAHFGLHEAFPENAVRQGADLVIHSLHKTLPAMTQTALLHVSGNRVDRERLKRYLRIFQTSSPSYVLMASIDSCVNEIKKTGRERLECMLGYRRRLENGMSKCRHLRLVGPSLGTGFRMKAMDPGKLVIAVTDDSMTGQELYDILREKYHLQMEMAAEYYVLAILTLADTSGGIDRLAQALYRIDRDISEKKRMVPDRKKEDFLPWETVLEVPMTIAQAYGQPYELHPFLECTGKTAAEFINLYPPGIPFVVPGEKITKEVIKKIKKCLSMKLHVQGVENGLIKIIHENEKFEQKENN